MSLPFVGENWEGVGGGAFFPFEKDWANYRKTQITAESPRAEGDLAGWEPLIPAVTPARALQARAHPQLHPSGPPEEQPWCLIPQSFDGATLELLGALDALSFPWYKAKCVWLKWPHVLSMQPLSKWLLANMFYFTREANSCSGMEVIPALWLEIN